MAKTALTTLHDDIEAVRREAFAAGYAAAMQAIRELASHPAPGGRIAIVTPRRGRPAAAAPTAKRARQRRTRGAVVRPSQRASRTRGRRPQRGANARLIEEVLQSNAPRALRPAEIRSALQRDKGIAIAFTSIRLALDQLKGRNIVEQVADSKTWRYRGQGGEVTPG